MPKKFEPADGRNAPTLPEHKSEVTLPLADVAKQIRDAYAECNTAFHRGRDLAIDIGRWLNAAKGRLPHGQFTAWVGTECGIPMRTAQVYMQAANNLAIMGPDSDAATATLQSLLAPPKADKAPAPKAAGTVKGAPIQAHKESAAVFLPPALCPKEDPPTRLWDQYNAHRRELEDRGLLPAQPQPIIIDHEPVSSTVSIESADYALLETTTRGASAGALADLRERLDEVAAKQGLEVSLFPFGELEARRDEMAALRARLASVEDRLTVADDPVRWVLSADNADLVTVATAIRDRWAMDDGEQGYSMAVEGPMSVGDRLRFRVGNHLRPGRHKKVTAEEFYAPLEGHFRTFQDWLNSSAKEDRYDLSAEKKAALREYLDRLEGVAASDERAAA